MFCSIRGISRRVSMKTWRDIFKWAEMSRDEIAISEMAAIVGVLIGMGLFIIFLGLER